MSKETKYKLIKAFAIGWLIWVAISLFLPIEN
jgi:hypothetical protein